MSASGAESEWGDRTEPRQEGKVHVIYGENIETWAIPVRPITFLNPANNMLVHGGGVAAALRARYPREMDEDRKEREAQFPLPNGNYSVDVEDGEVLNVVYSPNRGWPLPAQEDYLKRVIISALQRAKHHTVVTTFFGCGIFGYHHDAARKAMNGALRDVNKEVYLLLPGQQQEPEEGQGQPHPPLRGDQEEEQALEHPGSSELGKGEPAHMEPEDPTRERAGQEPEGPRGAGARPLRIQALNQESSEEEEPEPREDRIFQKLSAKGELLPIPGQNGPIRNHWFLDKPLGKIPKGPLCTLQPVGANPRLNTANLIPVKARYPGAEMALGLALSRMAASPAIGERKVECGPEGKVHFFKVIESIPRAVGPEAGAVAGVSGLCIINLRQRRYDRTMWQTVLAEMLPGFRPRDHGHIVVLVPSMEEAEEVASSPEDWDEEEPGEGSSEGPRRETNVKKPVLKPPAKPQVNAPVRGTNSRSRSVERRRINPRARPCTGPTVVVKNYPFTPFAGEAPPEPEPDWESHPWGGYDADELSIRGAESGPWADDVYGYEGVPEPWKHAYLAAGYDYYKDQIRKRDRSVEKRRQDRARRELSPQSRSPSPSRRGPRADPPRPQTPFRPIEPQGEAEPEFRPRRLNYDAPVFTPAPIHSPPSGQTAREKMVQMMTPGRGTPEQTPRQPRCDWTLQLGDVIPRRDREESDVEILHRAADALGGPDRLDDGPVTMFLVAQRGVHRLAGLQMSDVLTLRTRVPGQSEQQEKANKALQEVKAGKTLLSTAMACLTAEGIPDHMMEQMMMELPGATLPRTDPSEGRLLACQRWDKMGAAHRMRSRHRPAPVERPFTRSQRRPEPQEEQPRDRNQESRRRSPPQQDQAQSSRTSSEQQPRRPKSGDGAGSPRPPRPRVSDEEWNRMGPEERSALNKERREWDRKHDPVRYQANQKKWEERKKAARQAQSQQKSPQ